MMRIGVTWAVCLTTMAIAARTLSAGKRVSAERQACVRAVAAAKLPQAAGLKMVDPIYPHCGPKGSDYSVSTARDVPEYLKGAVMYQLFLRPFTPEGTLKAAEKRLAFVRSLGTDIIYLCPVATADRGEDRKFWSQRQKSSRLNNPCNPYRIADYFSIDPEYGTEQDMKDFVATAHRLGMKVYFDLVYYHCGPNAVFLKEHPEWVLREADGSFTLGQWAFPRLDVKNPEVREYLFENMKWYLTEFAGDGFRCDVGGKLPLWYREEAYRRNRKVKSDVVMMCEGNDPREQQVAFDLCYAFPMQSAIMDFLKGRGGATNLSVRCVEAERKYPKKFHWMRCFQNHDYANCNPGDSRLEKRHGLDLNDGLLATIFTLDGVPMVYNGQEIADTAPHSIWSNRKHGKWGIDWSSAATPEGEHRLALVKELSRMRHEHPSFFDAPTEWLTTEFSSDVYAFRRPLSDGTSWITAVNISTNDRAITVLSGHSARLAGPGATLDSATGKLVLPAKSWLVAADGPFPLVRLPNRGKDLEGRFHPTYASAHDARTTMARPVPKFLRGGVMYQLFTRMFTPEGTFAAARARLVDLKADGIDIIYLAPHQLADDDPDPRFWSPRQKACRMGNPKNPYRQKDFFAVDPEYGTKDDLKAFVAEAHRLGMKVMFDLVYFHCGPRAVFLKEHPDFIVRNPDGTPKLGDWAFPELDVAKPSVREYLYSNMESFVRDYDVDGFRCDVADMLPVDFWEEGYRRCKALKPDVFMLCEGLKGDDQIAAFDLSYGFYTQWTLVAMLEGKSPASMLEKAWRAQVRDYPCGFHWMRCFENHDFAHVNPGQKRKEELYGHSLNAAMIATCFMLDGVPMLYNGQEVADARPHSIYSNRNHGKWCIDWSRAKDGAAVARRALVRRLADIRHAHPDLFDAPVVWHSVPEPGKAYAFSRPLPDGTTFTLAVNISNKPVSFTLSGGRRVSLGPHGFDLHEGVSSSVEVSCASHSVTLEGTRKGAVSRIVTSGGVELGSSVRTAPLFNIKLVRVENLTNAVSVTGNDAARFSMKRDGDCVRLLYENVGKYVEKVVCSVAGGREDAKLRWRIAVTPRDGWAVIGTTYPALMCAEQIGARVDDDAIVTGAAKGGLVRGNGKMDLSATSPGPLSAQFMCLYDSSALLYSAAEDGRGHSKTLHVRRERDGVRVQWTRNGFDTNTVASGYEIVTAAIDGTDAKSCVWQDAADIYREWARRQPWCRVRYLDRSDVPVWMKDAPAMVRFSRDMIGRPDSVRDWMKAFWKRLWPDVPLMMVYWGWEKHGLWQSDYFPVYPSDEAFASLVKDCKAMDGHAFLWPSGYYRVLTSGKQADGTFKVDMRSAYEEERGDDYACISRNGMPYRRKPFWLGGGESACLCGGTTFCRDWWNRGVCLPLAKLGVEMIQADQLIGGSFPECWNRAHGHELGEGHWKSECFRAQLKTMREAMLTHETDAVVCFEEPCEIFNDMVGIQDYRSCEACVDEWASVFSYIYHEYIPCFQSNPRRGDRVWQSHAAADGQIPFLMPGNNDVAEGVWSDSDRAYVAFMREWIKLYRGRGRKYLAYGRQMRPPAIDVGVQPFSIKRYSKSYTGTRPCVFHSAWQARDGSKALVFVNATDAPQRVGYVWEGEPSQLTLNPDEIRIVECLE